MSRYLLMGGGMCFGHRSMYRKVGVLAICGGLITHKNLGGKIVCVLIWFGLVMKRAARWDIDVVDH